MGACVSVGGNMCVTRVASADQTAKLQQGAIKQLKAGALDFQAEALKKLLQDYDYLAILHR